MISLTLVREEESLSVMTVPKVFGVVAQGDALELDWLFNIFCPRCTFFPSFSV